MDRSTAQPASPALYTPRLADDPPRGLSSDNSTQPAGLDLMSIDQCQNLRDVDDSQLVGASDEVSAAASAAARGMKGDGLVSAEVKVAESFPAKRRRGRPPRGQGKTDSAPPKVKQAEEEEDVCFICFDGGSLVLCDRRGCPKAYHPTCIKRDEAFFQSKAKWNCGWHICSSCQKASHYMCYTCTFSSCKGCVKDADYVCVRGNQGLCGICMRTIMLIEDNVPGNPGAVQVDFDDKSSWEYLFKVYWVYLKEKLSLTLDELTQAKNPWKGLSNMSFKGGSLGEFHGGSIGKHSSSVNSYLELEGHNSKRKRIKKQPTRLNNDCCPSMQMFGSNKEIPLPEGKKWATKELLEFVAHVRNGDISVLSQFDVQSLLLEYIKRNNLRDPEKKCEIICDSRLLNLFGKERVGHIEMLKLLEFQFLMKESAPTNDMIQGVVLNACSDHGRADGISDNQLVMINGKRRKTRKKNDVGGPNLNLDEYAAIDVHNIKLIFLRRSLMENLIDDTDKFHDKVVGSIVRIRISNSDHMQDTYRLVQVVGTSKVTEPYKVGTKIADVMLEILNLDKKEVVPIDEISNQEFSEEECKRLRQYIKCGLIKRLTVGEIQEKAIKLQAVKVTDWLEAEILRLSHLRDRASEKGLRKELRECVEKIRLLNSSEERQRKLLEIPKVHTDPSMDPNHDSEDGRDLDWKKSGNHVRLENFGFGRRERESISPLNACTQSHVDNEDENSWNQNRSFGLNSLSTSKNQVHPTGSAVGFENNIAAVKSESNCGVASEISSTGIVQSVNNIEIDKLWNYKDPTGKIQGPFCLVQLRKWSISGHFPPELRIWRVNGNQDDSILLTDALDGRYDAEQQLSHGFLSSEEVKVSPIVSDDQMDGGFSKDINATQVNIKKEERCDTKQNDENALSNGKEESERSKDSGSHSFSSTPPQDVINSDEEKAANVLLGLDSLKSVNSWPAHSQVCCSLPSASVSGKPFDDLSDKVASVSGKPFDGLSDKVRESVVSEGSKSSHDNGNWNSHENVNSHADSGHSHDKQSNSESNSGQSSAEDQRPPTVNSYSNGMDSNSVSMAKSNETSKHYRETSLLELFGPLDKTDDDTESQLAENKHPVTSDIPLQESGPSWSDGSSLVVSGPLHPEVTKEFSPPAQPSIEEWDSKIVPASSVKPTELVSDQAATPTSMNELTHSSTPHPIPNAFSWQVIVDGPDEFSPLVDESVSDLLAEVEAMESLCGLSSPTSIMSGELVQDSKMDCFDPAEGFSPVHDLGKNDSLSSTRDFLQVTQFTVKDEPCGISEADGSQKRSIEHSSASAKVDTKSTSNQWGAGIDMHPPSSSIETYVMASPDTTWRLGRETTKPVDVSARRWEANASIHPPVSSVGTLTMSTSNITTAPTKASDASVSQWQASTGIQPPISSSTGTFPMAASAASWASKQGNSNLGWAGLAQVNTNMDWTATGHDAGTMPQHQTNVNWSSSTANQGFWGNQLRHSPRDRQYQGGGGDDRSRPSSNRHFGGGGNGGGSHRSPKGQRVCKYYESGHCKKGASCSYLHP